MTHEITLTDGTTSIALFNLLATFPTEWLLAAADGDAETVGEAIGLLVRAASKTALQTLVRSIDRLLDDAARRTRTQAGARVFLTVKWDGEADTWRSEVLGGRLEMANAAAQWGRLALDGTLAITRRAFWEGPETQLPLTNGNGTNNTSGLDIFNCSDGSGTSPNKRHNYAQIAGADVAGSSPAPLKIELKNATGNTMLISNLYLTCNAHCDPVNLAHMIEAESRAYGGTVQADSACSGGSKAMLVSYVSGAQIYWNLTETIISKTAGAWVRLLLALRSRTATQVETVQADLRDSTGVNVRFRGPEVPINRPSVTGNLLVDLGSFPLPPGGADVYERVQLWLTFRLASGTASTALDFVQIAPLEAYRHVQTVSGGILPNDVIVDDGIDGLSYGTFNGYKGPFARGVSGVLQVWPGRVQRIYVLADYDGAPFAITDRWKVRAWYRPRRLSL